MTTQQVHHEVAAFLAAVRSHLENLAGDPDGDAIARKIAQLEQRVAAASGRRERDDVVGEIRESWRREKETFAGWEHEQRAPTWDAYVAHGHIAGMDDLLMPKTVTAIQRCHAWLRSAMLVEKIEKYSDDAAVVSVFGEVNRAKEAAALKLSRAFNRMIDDAHVSGTPTVEREVDTPEQLLVPRTYRWFEHTKYLEANMARANAFCEKRAIAIAACQQVRLDVYKRLSAEADATWPAIERTVKCEEWFDPTDLDRWRNKTVKLGRVHNRAGWDFDDSYDFATRIGGVPVAGNYDLTVCNAVNQAERRVGRSLDEHAQWDVIAVVEGQGAINQRTKKKMTVAGTSESWKLESLDPTPCVTIRIIALHAGPVAVGPL